MTSSLPLIRSLCGSLPDPDSTAALGDTTGFTPDLLGCDAVGSAESHAVVA